MASADPCFFSLRDAILAGTLAPGDRLPPERQLADRFGVNRVTVRSALQRLAAQSLVQPRQGSGYVVQDYARQGGPELLPGLAALAREQGQTGALARDLLLVRRSLARGVLERLASEPPDDAAVAQVELAVAQLAAAVAQNADDSTLAERDLDVLRAVLEATGSAALLLCLNPIASALLELPRLRRAIYADPASNVVGWRALLAWLRSPAPDGVDAIAALLAARDEATLRTLSAEETP